MRSVSFLPCSLLCVALLLLLCDAPLQGQPTSDSYAIPNSVIASGGGSASSGSYALNSTAGQPAVGTASSSSFEGQVGFWPGLALAPSPDGPPLTVEAPATAVPGETITVPVVAGSEDQPVSDLFGVGFELSYDSTRLAFQSVAPGSFIDDGDVLETTQSDSNVVAYSVTRKEGADGVTGSGPVAVFTFQVRSDAPGGEAVFSPGDVLAIDPPGDEITLTPVTDSTSVAEEGLLVWPGDTDNSGADDPEEVAVTAEDLFPIANCFGLTGPVRNPDSLDIDWEGQPAEAWGFPGDGMCTSNVTDDPAHADAVGDGTIDQNDVLPVGANFGLTRAEGGAPSRASEPPALASGESEASLAELELPAPQQGDVYEVNLKLSGEPGPPAESYYGVSARLQGPPDLFALKEAVAGKRLNNGDLLRITHEASASGVIAAAFTRKRGATAVSGGSSGKKEAVLTMRLRAKRSAPGPVDVTLVRVSVNGGRRGAQPLSPRQATLGSPQALARPEAFALRSNYPNPFGERTTIRYALPEATTVHLAVYDALGRKVRTLVDEKQRGRKTVTFAAGDLASGVYFVRMSAGDYTASRKMVLVR